MKFPIILFDYLESTEQDPYKMTKRALLTEAEYVASPEGNWMRQIDEYGHVVEDYGYTPQEIGALTRFINRLRKEVFEDG